MTRPTTLTGTAALAAVTAVGLTACSTPGAGGTEQVPGVTQDTVTIGTHTPLTGPAAEAYAQISAAVSAYFEYVNANGGIHGRTIEYVVKDDGYNPANTQTVTRELVSEDDVFAMVNGLGTPTHTTVLDYLDQNDVPDLFVASGSAQWNQPEEYPNTFGMNLDYVTDGMVLATHATEQDPDAKLCVLGQDDDYGGDVLAGVEAVVGADGVVASETYNTSNQDLTAQVGAMKAADCTHAVLATIPGFTAIAMGTAAQLEWFPQYLVSNAGADVESLAAYLGEEGAPLLEGMLATGYLPTGQDNEWYELFSEINDEYNDGAPLTGTAIYGYSVGYHFAEALARAGENPTRASLLEVMESGELVGNGVVPNSLSADDHSPYHAAGITVVSGGAQSYTGDAWAREGDTLTEIELEPKPVENEGIPTGE
ncbi:ABC transporter substrate-binding protein [Myceligenerans xiligouense]|uniref:Amino acid/amide ABC transporter substrate-binding protein (HAAT family) n=1 Tax=Myceligenerans xiligouense TaxID=253184 RepID=A0A3N4ZHR3_9MICO|nr:ABC transporter substrate-binding protein [Myceligenerans xiligouense]RPF20405.1 amino acid/amide ABC transporter substrate-binding protein (HAAT family) [Myceligenerans xiligouense]